jgi:hypothetical protein
MKHKPHLSRQVGLVFLSASSAFKFTPIREINMVSAGGSAGWQTRSYFHSSFVDVDCSSD